MIKDTEKKKNNITLRAKFTPMRKYHKIIKITGEICINYLLCYVRYAFARGCRLWRTCADMKKCGDWIRTIHFFPHISGSWKFKVRLPAGKISICGLGHSQAASVATERHPDGRSRKPAGRRGCFCPLSLPVALAGAEAADVTAHVRVW